MHSRRPRPRGAGAALEEFPWFDESDEEEDEEKEDTKRHYELMAWFCNRDAAKQKGQNSLRIDEADEVKEVAPEKESIGIARDSGDCVSAEKTYAP